MNKAILLSFDIEEFDVPQEYGQSLSEAEQFSVSFVGLQAILSLLSDLELQATFFVTANFANQYPDTLREMAIQHEIASHGYYHSSFAEADLQKSRATLETIIQRDVYGFRMARLQPISSQAIAAAGYTYNSSLNPTYIPGRYNHFFARRTPYFEQGLLHIPVSVTPLIRFPLFWLSFKNFPLGWMQLATEITLEVDRSVNLYFHPWEFTDISAYRLPGYIKRHSGLSMRQRLRRYLLWLKTQASFITFSEFYLRCLQAGKTMNQVKP